MNRRLRNYLLLSSIAGVLLAGTLYSISSVNRQLPAPSPLTEDISVSRLLGAESAEPKNLAGGARTAKSTSLPVRSLQALEEKGRAGDVLAARQLAEYSTRCWRYGNVSTEAIVASLDQGIEGLSEQSLAAMLKDLDELQSFLAKTSLNKEFCKEFGPYLLEHRADLLLTAANAGDQNSRNCYLEAITHFDTPPSSVHRVLDYRVAALKFAEQGLANGDWSVVRVMWSAYAGGSYSYHSKVEPVVIPDRAAAYRYAKLLSLGDPGPDGPFPAENINEYGRTLPADVVQAGDEWANEVFGRYFYGTELNRGAQICN